MAASASVITLKFFCRNIEEIQWLRWWRVCLQCGKLGFNPWVRKIPWKREWQPTPVFLPGKSHEWRSLAGPSPWGRKESDTTERLTHTMEGKKIQFHFKEMKKFELFLKMQLTKFLHFMARTWLCDHPYLQEVLSDRKFYLGPLQLWIKLEYT